MTDDINKGQPQGSTPSHDQGLIEELYEKLWWYTYEASEEEYDDKKVQAIIQLLDVLDPLSNEPQFNKHSAFERFKDRYDLHKEFPKKTSDDFNEEYAADFGLMADDVIRVMGSGPKSTRHAHNQDDMCDQNREDVLKGKLAELLDKAENEDAKNSETDSLMNVAKTEIAGLSAKRFNCKRLALRIGMGLAACIVLMLSLNVGTYALKKKSFFEIVKSEFGRTKVTVTGNLDEVDTGESKKDYSSWEELENDLGISLLKPSYLPADYELQDLNCVGQPLRFVVNADYYGKSNNKHIIYNINAYGSNYSDCIKIDLNNFTLVYEDTYHKVKYYQMNDNIKVVMTQSNYLYVIVMEESLDTAINIVNSIFNVQTK